MSVSRPVAVVTGACRAGGPDIAVELADRGFDLALLDATDGVAQATIDAIWARDGLASVHRADLSDVSGHDGLLERIVDECGPIACVVNHGATWTAPGADLLDLAPERFDQAMERELRGTFFFTQAAARRMAGAPAAGPRSIITVSALCGAQAAQEAAASCLSRAGLGAMTRLFAQRLAPLAIGVYQIRSSPRASQAVEPGPRGAHRQRLARAVAAVASGQVAFASGSVIDIDQRLPSERH